MDLQEVLSAAVAKEVAASRLYRTCADGAEDPAVRALMSELAADEEAHRELLESLDAERIEAFSPEARRDLRITEYLEDRSLAPESGLQATMIHAMHREGRARDFYSAMESRVGDERARELFRKLSTMENTHKAQLEELYESTFMRES